MPTCTTERARSALIGDPSRLRQVLVNLVGNAIKFTEEGEVLLTVGLENQNQHEVVLCTSPCATPASASRSTSSSRSSPFIQADGSTTRRFGGTGLGLTISSQLVELMGGRLWAGEHGRAGSTFHFTVNLRRAATAVAAAPGIDWGTLQGMRALIVDDNATNRRILAEMLGNWGLQPATGRRRDRGQRGDQRQHPRRTPVPPDPARLSHAGDRRPDAGVEARRAAICRAWTMLCSPRPIGLRTRATRENSVSRRFCASRSSSPIC